jgi:hypothetical protein
MPISTISNIELGSSVRAKLNLAIEQLNVTGPTFENLESVASLGSFAFSNFNFNLGKSGLFTSVVVTQPCWLVAYTSAANRTADVDRTITTDPLPGSGILLELIATSATEIFITPAVGYWAPANVFFRVQNTGDSTQNIDVTIKGTRFN